MEQENKWLPILEKLGITGDKAKMLSEYADLHEKAYTSTATHALNTFENLTMTIPYIRSMHIGNDNKLIADFMGVNGEIPIYNCDWGLLMPVVVKIEEGNYGIKQCRKVVEIYFDDTKEIIIKEKKQNKMASLYEAIVKFIKWKNENNK